MLEHLTQHALIDRPAPAYSDVTVRRAFIVWLRCGQTNKFRDVCNYYHNLESLEEKMSAKQRAISRHQELDLFVNPPPTSKYLTQNHPNLYKSKLLDAFYVKKVEDIKNIKCIFKLEGFEDIGPLYGLSREEIAEASQLVRNFCSSHYITLKKFAAQFKGYTAMCFLPNTVENMKRYIKKILIKDDLELYARCPKNFEFLTCDGRRFSSGSSSSSDSSDLSIITSRPRLFSSLEYIPISSNSSSEYNSLDWTYDDATNTLKNQDIDDEVFKDKAEVKKNTETKESIKKMNINLKDEERADPGSTNGVEKMFIHPIIEEIKDTDRNNGPEKVNINYPGWEDTGRRNYLEEMFMNLKKDERKYSDRKNGLEKMYIIQENEEIKDMDRRNALRQILINLKNEESLFIDKTCCLKNAITKLKLLY